MHCNCCKECTKRTIECHVYCEEYQEFVTKHNEEKKAIEIQKLADTVYHKVGSPGICFGIPTKRRVRPNAYK